MHVQRLTAGHAPQYRALMLHAYAAAPGAFTSTPEDRVHLPESWWRQRLDHPQGLSQVFGALVHGELVGAVAIEFSDRGKTRHKAHLAGLFVQAPHRAGGAGAQLVHAAMAAARARPGVCVVQLTVTEGNAPALALYARHGFQTFGTEPMAIATPEGYLTKIHMWAHWSEAAAI